MFDAKGASYKSGKQVYSPKIYEDLISDLYKIAKAKKIPMTKLVNDIIADAIRGINVEVKKVKEKVEVEKEVYVLAEDEP